MLLLTGRNLNGATVTTQHPGVRVSKTEEGASSHYLFVWLQIAADVMPGALPLQVRSGSQTTTVSFPLLSRQQRQQFPGGVSQNDVIYLVMPDRFADGDPSNDQPPNSTAVYDRNQPKAYHGGDLQGIRQRLPYLHELGVTTLWLTPVWKNTDSDYHGYHVVDFYAIDPHMGALQDYQALVGDAHKLGMKVLIDYVTNHTGPHIPWAKDPPTSHWFNGTPENHLAANYQFNGLTDPHATPRSYRDVLQGWFVDKLPDLNADDPLVAEYLDQNALWWTEVSGLDGFRLDTFPYSSRRFWSGWHAAMRQVYPGLFTVGEVADSDPTITSFFAGGRKQFDGVDSGATTIFDFPLFHAIRDVILRNAPVQRMIDVLRQDSLYPHPENLVTFIGNHDNCRFMGEKGSSKEKLEAAVGLLLTLRGIPQIYSGDEIGMPGGDDPDNRRDFPGGFPGDPRSAFTLSGRTPEQQEIFSHVRTLIRLRQAHPALRTGHEWHIGWDDTYFAFLRETPEERLLVVFNNADRPRSVDLALPDTPLERTTEIERLLGSGEASLQEKAMRLTMPAESVSIYQVK